MSKVSGGQRGSAVVLVLMALIVLAAAVAFSRGCGEPPAPAAAVATLPPPSPPATAALPETAPAAAVAPPGVRALVVHNPCDQPLLMAVNFADAGGARVSEGFFQIARGARSTPATRSGPLYLYDKTIYFYTETTATEPVEVGQHDEIVGDRQLGMKQVDLDLPAVSTITLECPGFTSGRP